MPIITPMPPGSEMTGVNSHRLSEDLGYAYPGDMDLRPEGETHKKIMHQLLRRAQMSWATMSAKHPVWDEIDRTQTAYIRLDKYESEQKKDDDRLPMPLVVPYSFAIRETLLTHWMGTFVNSPMFTFSPVGPEDTVGAMLLEQVIDLQMQRSRAGLAWHQVGNDVLKYGLGGMTPVWKRHDGKRTVMQPRYMPLLNQLVQVGEDRVDVPVTLFEGHELQTLDPRTLFPDMQAPLGDPQRGEYIGWMRREQFHDLRASERTSEGTIFNVEYLRDGDYRSPMLMGTTSSGENVRRFDQQYEAGTYPVDVLYMYVKLIPKDWELGDSDIEEKWLFGLAGDRVLIRAQRMDLNHNLFPVGIACPDYDGYSQMPVSQMEIISGLQEVVDFLINSHVAEVRESLNNTWLVDPMSVNVQDFKNRNSKRGGRIIRTRMGVWGKGVENVAKQFPVTDATREHLPQASFVQEMMQHGSGAHDITMGLMKSKSGERRTREEVETAKMAALSRLGMRATVAGLQLWHPLAMMLASQTQQFMNEDVYVRSTGRWAQELTTIFGDGQLVNFRDLLVDYDVTPGASAQMIGQNIDEWRQMIVDVSSNPQLNLEWDSSRMLLELMRRMGEKNGADFRRKIPPMTMQVMPDAQVQAEAQAGNLMPVEAM